MLKSLTLESHLSVGFSSFNLRNSRLASKQKANAPQEDFDRKETLIYMSRNENIAYLTEMSQRFTDWFLNGW